MDLVPVDDNEILSLFQALDTFVSAMKSLSVMFEIDWKRLTWVDIFLAALIAKRIFRITHSHEALTLFEFVQAVFKSIRLLVTRFRERLCS